MALPEQSHAAFARLFGRAPEGIAVAPGRVNLIGEHTDYNDGFVLPMGVERGVAAAFSGRDDGVVRAYAASFDEMREAAIDALAPGTIEGWMAYVGGVAWAFREAGVARRGVDLAI